MNSTTSKLGADMLNVPRDLLQDLTDDVADYAVSRTFKDRETTWRSDLLKRARDLLARQPAAIDKQCERGEAPLSLIPELVKQDQCAVGDALLDMGDAMVAWRTEVGKYREITSLAQSAFSDGYEAGIAAILRARAASTSANVAQYRNEALSALLVDHSHAASAKDVDAVLKARDAIYSMFANVAQDSKPITDLATIVKAAYGNKAWISRRDDIPNFLSPTSADYADLKAEGEKTSSWHPDFVVAMYENSRPDKLYTMDQMREYADAFHRSRIDAANVAQGAEAVTEDISLVRELQKALFYWMPRIAGEDSPAGHKAAEHAYLLIGLDDNSSECYGDQARSSLGIVNRELERIGIACSDAGCPDEMEVADFIADLYARAQAATVASTDDARECLADVASHYRALYAGLAFQLNEATVSENSDDMTYWKHEIKALERMYEQAERALTAAQSASASEGKMEDAR